MSTVHLLLLLLLLLWWSNQKGLNGQGMSDRKEKYKGGLKSSWPNNEKMNV